MKIEIDLNDLGFHYDEDGDRASNRTLQDAVIAEAARQVLATSGWEYRSELNKFVQDAAQQAVRERMEAALAQPIQRRHAWGEKVGEATTLLEIAREELGKFLAAPAPARDPHNRSEAPRNLTDLVMQTVAHLMRNELADEVRKARTEVTDKLRTEVTKAVAGALMSDRR